jgi:hypothetical protein
MLRFFGNAQLSGFGLKYYVFGNRRDGYSIRITEKGGANAEQYVSHRLIETVRLAYKLRRYSVFPENLSEILDDIHYSEMDPRPHHILQDVSYENASEKIGA